MIVTNRRISSEARDRSRRQFLTGAGLTPGLLFSRPGLFAQQLVLTPAQTLGPYYPDRLPLDQDNDLIRINENITPAIGEISWLSGRVLGRNGALLRNALVEIWQADVNGAYIHSQSPSSNRDPNFQGYGRFVTGTSGEYLFRTVKPGLYPGRTRHVHVQVTAASGEKLVSQLYIAGETLNANDSVLRGISNAEQRSSVIVPWTAIADSKLGELQARWDIVFGFTPSESTSQNPEILPRGGVVNGGGYQAGITAGAWLSIFGDHLSNTTRTWKLLLDFGWSSCQASSWLCRFC